MKFKNQDGFTLIELIMVMIILGILAAVAIPRYASTITKAEEADGVAVTDTIATSAKTIVSSPTIVEGTEEPTKKRRGRPPSAKTLSKDVAETEAKVVVPTTVPMYIHIKASPLCGTYCLPTYLPT